MAADVMLCALGQAATVQRRLWPPSASFFEQMSIYVSKCEPSCAAVGTGLGESKVHCGMDSHKEIRMNATLASAWERTHLVARGALVALALTACGQSTDGASQPSADASDTATAYLKLSDDVKACQDAKDTCVTDAAGDATKLAACDTDAQSCIDKTQADQSNARKHLRDDAEGCVRECRGHRHHDGEDAGSDDTTVAADGGATSTRDCFGRRGNAPAFNEQCRDDFFTCLDTTGVRMSSGMDLDDATKEAVVKCVETAHSCFMSDMMSRGGRGPGQGGPGRGGPGHRGAAGEPAHDAAGAGGHGDRPRGPRNEDGGVSDDDQGRGRNRGPGGGAAGGDPGRRHRGGAAGEPADAGI